MNVTDDLTESDAEQSASPQLADPLLTAEQVRRIIPIAEATQRHWRYAGSGPEYVRLGRRIFYRLSAVERWIAEQERAQSVALRARRGA
ncbi:MAG: helix-turn-helix transcriptional regulator [Rhodococcus sp. (in: high G+C Gram-positive bacteria)]